MAKKGIVGDSDTTMFIKFSNWESSEKVLCDVVDMDSCHIFLGRPWLFHRNVSHDGKENTYEFKKDGKQYKLTLMMENTITTKENKHVNVDNSHIMFCSAKEFLKEGKKEYLCLVIIPKRVQEMEKLNYVPL